MPNAFEFVLLSLTVWRVARMITLEDGPLAAFLHFRSWLADKPPSWQWLADGFACPLCLSFWLALVPALWFSNWLVVWLSLAGSAAVIYRIVG